MDDVKKLAFQLKAARSEISKLHRQMNALTRTVQQELSAVRRDALRAAAAAPGMSVTREAADDSSRQQEQPPASSPGSVSSRALVAPCSYPMTPVGFIESCFVYRNGTPRQPGLASAALSKLQVRWGAHPAHTTAGIEAYSHVWLLFVFHDNRGEEVVKSKAKPPRLHGAATGIFGCRTPHRPNPLGLSLVKLERVEGDTLHLSGAGALRSHLLSVCAFCD